METIHRLYCTHTSDERFGVRASTLDDAQTRQLYESLRQYLHYDLPEDTPDEAREMLTAQTAPKRLFLVKADRWVVAGQVCYRQYDSVGRPGCYFADILVQNTREVSIQGAWDGGQSWDPADVLTLWGAPGWQEEDTDQEPQALQKLEDLWQNRQPIAPLDLFHRLLTNQPLPGGEVGLSGAIPKNLSTNGFPAPRVNPGWPGLERSETSGSNTFTSPKWLERLQGEMAWYNLFLRSFSALVRSLKDHKPLVIIGEPELAVLLFLGMLKLLPPEKLRREMTFSTFETKPAHLDFRLVATNPYNPEQSQLLEQRFLPVAEVVDTFAPDVFQTPGHHEIVDYARLMTDVLVREGYSGVERCWDAIAREEVPVETATDLERVAEIEQTAKHILSGEPQVSLPATNDPFHGYLCRHLCHKLADIKKEGNFRQEIAPVVGQLYNYCLLLELVYCRWADYRESLQKPIYTLIDQVNSWDMLAALLQARIVDDWKQRAVAVFITKARMPQQLDPLVNSLSPPTGNISIPLLARALRMANRDVRRRFAQWVKDKEFFTDLCLELKQQAGRTDVLGALLDPLDSERFYRLCFANDWAFLRESLPADPVLREKLSHMVCELHKFTPQSFDDLDRLLYTLSHHQQHLTGHAKLIFAGWQRCFEISKRIRKVEQTPVQQSPAPFSSPPKRMSQNLHSGLHTPALPQQKSGFATDSKIAPPHETKRLLSVLKKLPGKRWFDLSTSWWYILGGLIGIVLAFGIAYGLWRFLH